MYGHITRSIEYNQFFLGVGINTYIIINVTYNENINGKG